MHVVRPLVYTDEMSERAKIFTSGDSQAVRLPKSMEFPNDLSEVLVRRVGRAVILEPEPAPDEGWSAEFLASLGSWDEEIERLPRSVGVPKDPFE
jgi:virulence-associated protein VagC